MLRLGGPAYELCSKKLYVYNRCLIERLSIAIEKEHQKLGIVLESLGLPLNGRTHCLLLILMTNIQMVEHSSNKVS